MGLFHKRETTVSLYALCEGEIQDISAACDDVFAQKMMGDGILLEPLDGRVFAPCNAAVLMCFPTKHAIGLQLENGVELLLHFGVDTVNLNGEGFDLKVSAGDQVAAGDLLWDADLPFIKAHAPSAAIMIVITANPKGLSVQKHLGMRKRNEKILEFQ